MVTLSIQTLLHNLGYQHQLNQSKEQWNKRTKELVPKFSFGLSVLSGSRCLLLDLCHHVAPLPPPYHAYRQLQLSNAAEQVPLSTC